MNSHMARRSGPTRACTHQLHVPRVRWREVAIRLQGVQGRNTSTKVRVVTQPGTSADSSVAVLPAQGRGRGTEQHHSSKQ